MLGVNLLSCVSIGFYLAGFLSAGGETMCEVLFVILKGIIEVRALSRDCTQIQISCILCAAASNMESSNSIHAMGYVVSARFPVHL